MRRKMFLILCSSLSIVFLISYFLIYVIFRSVLYQEIEQQQANLQAYNETIFTSYIDSFGMVPFQLVNDEDIGTALNQDSDNSLDMFRAREFVRKKFNSYLGQQLFSSNLDCRLLLYLNEELPLSAHCDAKPLSEDIKSRTSCVYSSRKVSSEEWYQRTLRTTWSPYFFLNEETNELCYARCAWNYYLKSSISHDIGVIVIAIPQEAFLEKLTLEVSTPDSSVFITNEYGEILYASPGAPALLPSAEKDGEVHAPDFDAGRYLVSTASVNDNLFLTFVTPRKTITAMVQSALFPYLLFAFFFFPALIGILYLLSCRITAPVISLADLIGTIQDTRTFDTSLLSSYQDAELKALCQSFTDMIGRENELVERIIQENHEKRAATLHALQAQINPHFLYNALDIVSWLALNKNEDSIADIVSSISNMMHYSISRPDALSTLQQELDNIREFIRIYRLERPSHISLVVSASEEHLTGLQIPKFTLQPLVENAVLHNPELPALTITVDVRLIPEGFRITVTDNGAGADPEKLNAFLRYEETDLKVSSGFGIRNVNERLQLHYGNNSRLSYASTATGQLAAVLVIYN